MNERMEQIISPEELQLGKRVVTLFRSWHQSEQQRSEEDRIDIIDFDLAPESSEEIPSISREEVTRQLTDLESITPSTPFLEFIQAKAQASLTFLRAIDGEKLSLDEYAQKTLGITPEIIPDEELQEQKERVDEIFFQLGYQPTSEGYTQYFKENRLSQEEIVANFNEAKKLFVPIVVSKLGLENLLPLQYKEHVVSEDKYWICFISGIGSNINFRINTHPSTHSRWVKGRPEELAVHEMGGHLLQSLKWKDNVTKGLINPAYGITTLPDPEQWQSEGMANALPWLIPEIYDRMSHTGKFTFEMARLGNSVMNNVHIRANKGESIDTLKSYAQLYLPHETNEDMTKTIKDRTENPFNRSYLLTYTDGSRYFANAAKKLGATKSIDLLKTLYDHPMTPSQVKQYVSELEEN